MQGQVGHQRDGQASPQSPERLVDRCQPLARRERKPKQAQQSPEDGQAHRG